MSDRTVNRAVEHSIDRRNFVKSATAAAMGASTILARQSSAQETAVRDQPKTTEQESPEPEAPAVQTDSRTDEPVYVGNDEHRYQVHHDWFQLPEPFAWQTTHNVAVDKSGNVYVVHEGRLDQPDHPSIFVFDSAGAYIRSYGSELQGGGHGLEIREENGEEFIYASAYLSKKFITKMNLQGEQVWLKRAPMESGIYAENEATAPDGAWGRDRYMPTNFAFLDDGGFLVADGYGSWTIHRYDAEANFVSHFGSPARSDELDDEEGKFQLPHGIWIDDREEEKLIVVADRKNFRLQWFTLDGTHVRSRDGFQKPANIDVRGDLMLVPELHAQITLLNKDNSVAAVLGQDEAWTEKVLADGALRTRPADWVDGRFIHPHDACFDLEGNIIVAEWVDGGRVTKLVKV